MDSPNSNEGGHDHDSTGSIPWSAPFATYSHMYPVVMLQSIPSSCSCDAPCSGKGILSQALLNIPDVRAVVAAEQSQQYHTDLQVCSSSSLGSVKADLTSLRCTAEIAPGECRKIPIRDSGSLLVGRILRDEGEKVPLRGRNA